MPGCRILIIKPPIEMRAIIKADTWVQSPIITKNPQTSSSRAIVHIKETGFGNPADWNIPIERSLYLKIFK